MELQLQTGEVLAAPFPPVCARTGEDCEDRVQVILRRPGWRTYVSLLVPFPLLFVLLTWRAAARCTIRLPLTEDERDGFRMRQNLQFAAVLLGHLNTILVSVLLPVYLPLNFMKYYWWVIGLSILSTIAIVEAVRRTHFWIKKIGKDRVTLAGLHPRFVEEYVASREEW
jgi:hypothetical protein